MSQRIYLKGTSPESIPVDRHKIGISYSGGGPLVLIELGCARAFVNMGIVPDVVTGVSAGGLAGTAHALDPHDGKGIDMAMRLLCQISSSTLGLDVKTLAGRLRLARRVLMQRTHLVSVGDNGPIRPYITRGLTRELGLQNVTIGHFAPPDRPKLMIAATNRLNGEAVWFPDETPIEDVLVASSAIPGVFPWLNMAVKGRPIIVVDGGVVSPQPLSNLALEGCGTIIACAVGYAGGAVPAPANALENALGCTNLISHQCEKLEEDYVRQKLAGRGVVHHIHPDVAFTVQGYNFTPPVVEQIVSESCQKTTDWLTQHKEAATARHHHAGEALDPLGWLHQSWPDED